MNTKLKDVLDRAESWPEWARQELAELAAEIDREINAGTYHATREELRKIDEGLEAARRGEFATDEELEATFAKFHRA
jgi:predicted transcriptional regulator